MKPELLKKLRGRMRKRSSSDCSTRKCSLDSCDPSSSAQEGGWLNDSISSRRTVDEMQPVPEQAHVVREALSSSIAANNHQVPAMHHLPSADVSQAEPLHQYQAYPTDPHTHPPSHHQHSHHQHNPQENTDYPTYSHSHIRNGTLAYAQPPSSNAVAAVVPPPPAAMPAPEEDPSILQARKEAIEATAKLMGANHPDTLLAIQSMQKHCRNQAAAAYLYYSSG